MFPSSLKSHSGSYQYIEGLPRTNPDCKNYSRADIGDYRVMFKKVHFSDGVALRNATAFNYHICSVMFQNECHNIKYI